MPDFTLADAEFDRQATILETLVAAVEVASGRIEGDLYEIAGRPLPRIPPGGQNTMAAAAVVLLASHFEEYIRQQVEEYARELVLRYNELAGPFREKIVDVYWRAGSTRLSRIRPKRNPLWASIAEPLLRGLIEYPVSAQSIHFEPKLLTDHDRNMRWDVVVDMSARIGIKALSDQMYRSAVLRTEMGKPKKGDFGRAVEGRLGEFYELRNGIVHSISQNSGIGSATFGSWARFLRTLTTAYADALQFNFSELEKALNEQAADAA